MHANTKAWKLSNLDRYTVNFNHQKFEKISKQKIDDNDYMAQVDVFSLRETGVQYPHKIDKRISGLQTMEGCASVKISPGTN